MASIEKHFKGFSVAQGDIKVKVNLTRFEKQYQEAQFALDSAVMASMEPFMPMNDGTFINLTKARSAALAGTGVVCAGVEPMGRFLYEGKVMVDEETGSPWARPDAKKVLVSQYTGSADMKGRQEDLNYSEDKHPDAQHHWFDAAKEKDCKDWVKTVKRKAGGGQRG